MRPITHSLFALLVACGAADAASGPDLPDLPHFDVAQSSLARNQAPTISEADKLEITNDSSDFAIALHQQLAKATPGENLIYSPHSISTAIAMAYAGARNGTADEMAKALHYGLPQERLHPALNWLDLQLASRGHGAAGNDGHPFELRVVNSAWADKTVHFAAPYLDTLKVSYGVGLGLLDFVNEPDKARGIINDWTAVKTEGRVPSLLPAEVVTPLTRLTMVNAVYFGAAWAWKFDAGSTSRQHFTRLDGSQVDVPTLDHSASFPTAYGPGWRAVSLPYDGRELSMLVVVPDDLPSFEAALTTDRLHEIVSALSADVVEVRMPKFDLHTKTPLRPVLRSMGMEAAFDSEKADFTGVGSAGSRLFLSDFMHESICVVDEGGTVASAATAGSGELNTSYEAPPAPFLVDHPFYFTILDNATRAVVFAGRVADPSR